MAKKRFVQHKNLTGGNLEVNRRHGFVRRLLLILLPAILTASFAVWYFGDSNIHIQLPDLGTVASCPDSASELERLRNENQSLTEQLGKLRLDTEVDRATRAELERQLNTLRDELKDTRKELEFLKTANGKTEKR